MKDALKILRALLVSVYKIPDGEIDALLSNASETEDQLITALLARDSARVTELLKPKPGQSFQDGYKKAKGEVLTELETAVKTKFGIDSDLTGIDLLDHIVAEKSKGTGGTGKAGEQMTEDQIRLTPAYKKLETELKKQVADTKTEWETKFNEREAGYTKSKNFQTVAEKAITQLTTLEPVIPGTPTVAQTLQKTFLSHLEGYEYNIGDDGTIIPMKDGKVLLDAHGHNMTFDALVKRDAANFYEFKNNNGGGNAGNNNNSQQQQQNGGANGGKKQYPTGITKPTNFEEVMKIVNDTTIKLEDRQGTMDAWESEQAVGSGT